LIRDKKRILVEKKIYEGNDDVLREKSAPRPL
jgi:hypothetical protein